MNRLQSRAWFLDQLAEYFDLQERMPSLQWCVENIYIPESVSLTHPGPFNPDLFPLATIIYDWFDDPNWREFICPKSSQAGLSQACQNLTCYIAYYQLGHIMWVLESKEKAKEMNNERLKVMLLEGCDKLRANGHIIDENSVNSFVINLRGMRINMAGARTAGAVASRTLRFVWGDEADEWPTELQGGESNAWTLLDERVKLVPDSKRALFSKPRNSLNPEIQDVKKRNRKVKENGIIWTQYLKGSRHKCRIPCIACGHYFEITQEQIRFAHCRSKDGKTWDLERMKYETFIQCPVCPRQINDDEKVEMVLKHRQWHPTNLGDDPKNLPIPNRMSVHISDLYANSREFPKLMIGELAVKCVTGTTDDERKAYRRGHLALPVEQHRMETQRLSKIFSLAGLYPRGSCPVEPDAAFTLLDVQENGELFKWGKFAFTLDDSCYLIDNGATELEDEVANIMDAPFALVTPTGDELGKTAISQMGWIDEGDGTSINKVLDLCLTPRLYRRLSTCKGRGGAQTGYMTDRVMLQGNRSHQAKPIDRYLIDSEYFLDELYGERIAKHDDIVEADKTGQPRPAPRITLYKDPDPEFCQELCTEKKDWYFKPGGKLVFGWLDKPVGGKNDYSDITKMALAIWFRYKPKLLAARAKQAAQQAAAAAALAEKEKEAASLKLWE